MGTAISLCRVMPYATNKRNHEGNSVVIGRDQTARNEILAIKG